MTLPVIARRLAPAALLLLLAGALSAQVHYQPNGAPWNRKVDEGPDARVPGWWYNLGVTGLRVELIEDAPRQLLVRHVLEDSPAEGKVKVGDVLLGAGGEDFREPHRNGYGMEVFGAHGPISEFAAALELACTPAGRGRLQLAVLRDGRRRDLTLKLGTKGGSFGPGFPGDDAKSARVRAELLDLLVEEQRGDGSWGSVVADTFAPLALLTSERRKHRQAVEKSARFHAKNTYPGDTSGLVNWRYCAAGIVLGEYYLATGDAWVLDELQEVYDFLHGTQYMDLAQRNPRAQETHPHAWPETPEEKHGGWGHNPGHEGYGPIAMITGQGALAFALMARCGVEVDPERLRAAYAFLARGTGPNGYVWYEDAVGNPAGYADMGRTGAAGLALLMSPLEDPEHRARALDHARLIGAHPEPFPDTHGSPLMGMGYAAAAAWADPAAFRRLMDGNRWWLTLSECPDGSFYYQPNRDNAGYGGDSRRQATAVVAFLLSIPRGRLAICPPTAPAAAVTPDGAEREPRDAR